MTDYFDRLELELRGAVARTAAGSASQRRRHPVSLSGLAFTLAASVALATAVAMIAVLGHASRQPLIQARRPVTGAPTVMWARPCFSTSSPRCLLAQYAVLRRPQTEAEHQIKVPLDPSIFFAGQALHDVHIQSIPRLTRLVTLGAGRTLVLFVIKASLGPPSYYLGANLSVDGRPHTFAADWPFIPLKLGPQHTVAKWGIFASRPQWFAGYDVSIVPDPITRIRWTYTRSRTVSSRVHDNVAAAPAPAHPAPSVTAFDKFGRVVASTDRIITPIGPTSG